MLAPPPPPPMGVVIGEVEVEEEEGRAKPAMVVGTIGGAELPGSDKTST